MIWTRAEERGFDVFVLSLLPHGRSLRGRGVNHSSKFDISQITLISIMRRTLLLTLATIATASAGSNGINNNERRISPTFVDSVDRANVDSLEERPRRKLGWWGAFLFFGELESFSFRCYYRYI